MLYHSDSVATILNHLNIRFFLPAIQREFVWRPEQVTQLFDSILRGYPVGSFLFWDLKPENKAKWDVYRFIQDVQQGSTHNQLANTNGVQQLTLVLDGQQRFTSLLIGLKGSYSIKKPRLHVGNPNAWVKHILYLDLLHDPKTGEEDPAFGLRYSFHLLNKVPPAEPGHYWFEVGRILNCDNQQAFDDFWEQEQNRVPDDATKHQMKIFDKTLQRLYQAIWKDDVVAYYTETDQDYDRVLDIFVRANQGGTKLSKSDLLLSMVTAKWSGISAREEIYGFVEYLNNGLAHKNNFDKDFIMKACLVLSDLPVEYRVENFNNHNLDLIRTKWTAIKAAIERGVNLVNSSGIDRDTLTSANALIPIIYYIYQHPTLQLDQSTPFNAATVSRIRCWLAAVLLNNAFSGSSDSVLRDTRRVLQEQTKSSNDFPVREINTEVVKTGRRPHFDDQAIDTVLALTYGRQLTFLALSLLYDDNNWGSVAYQQDHIFPRALVTPKVLEAAGLSQVKQTRFMQLVNSLGNLELLLPSENLEKSAQPFASWLATRDRGFRKRHLIPDDDTLLNLDHFEEFVAGREQLIRQRLESLIVPLEVPDVANYELVL